MHDELNSNPRTHNKRKESNLKVVLLPPHVHNSNALQTDTHTHTYVYHTYSQMYRHINTRAHTHRFMHTHTNIYTCTYTQSRIHKYTIVTYSQAHSTQAYTHKLITMNRYILKYFYILKEDI